MGSVVALDRQVAAVGLGEVHTGRHPLVDGDTVGLELGGLVGVVAQQPDPVGADRAEHLGAGAVVPLVLAAAQREVRLVGVEAGVLQRVGVELGVEADAATLLAQVEQEPALLGDPLDRLAQLRAAVAPLRPEHVAGEALAVRPDERRRTPVGQGGQAPAPVAEAEQEVLLAVNETVEGDHVGRGGVAVREAQGYDDAGPHLGGRRGGARDLGDKARAGRAGEAGGHRRSII